MDAGRLKDRVQSFFDEYDDLGVAVYAVLKDGEEDGPVKLDIEAAALNDLKALFLQSVREIVLDDEDLSVLNISSCDERLNALYVYDLEIPEGIVVV